MTKGLVLTSESVGHGLFVEDGRVGEVDAWEISYFPINLDHDFFCPKAFITDKVL